MFTSREKNTKNKLLIKHKNKEIIGYFGFQKAKSLCSKHVIRMNKIKQL